MGIAISTCCNAWRAPLQLLCGPADEAKPAQALIEYAGGHFSRKLSRPRIKNCHMADDSTSMTRTEAFSPTAVQLPNATPL